MNPYRDELGEVHEADLVRIDPGRIDQFFCTAADWSELHAPGFERLKSSIQHTGGNLQPIKVRPLGVLMLRDVSELDRAQGRYEIVFGHSRLLACLELGLPVLAISECMNDVEVAQQFSAEYLSGQGWRPWRMGDFINRAMAEGLFPSCRRAAETLGIDHSEFRTYQLMAEFPAPVRKALRALSLSRANGKKIAAAYVKDPSAFHAFDDTADSMNGRTASKVLRKLAGGQ